MLIKVVQEFKIIESPPVLKHKKLVLNTEMFTIHNIHLRFSKIGKKRVVYKRCK